MVITFIGHSLVSAQDKIKQEVKEQIKANMLKTEQAVFYNGGYGDFDNVCAIACKELKKEFPDIEIVYISPYISPSEQEKIKELQRCGLCDATIYPPIEGVPLKFAISKRNEWMVTSADLIIAYVNHSFGGAYKSLALRESNPFGLKWKIDCLPVLKKLDNSLIACTFLPCNPTYFLI